MPTGDCFCGNVKIAYTGEPVLKSICHCLDDRKISGSLFSCVFTILSTSFTVTAGTPRTITKTSDHGKSITSHFCADCGTTLFRTGGSQPEGMLGVRVGVLNDIDVVNDAMLQMELYVERRPGWLKAVEGAEQRDEKYELVGSGGMGKGIIEEYAAAKLI